MNDLHVTSEHAVRLAFEGISIVYTHVASKIKMKLTMFGINIGMDIKMED